MLQSIKALPVSRDSFFHDLPAAKFRLITRSDMDGLVCGTLLKELGLVDEIFFVHPKDMQDGKIEVTDRDISTNLPYVPGIYAAFDHHESEGKRMGGVLPNHILSPSAPSAARVVFDYFGGKTAFPKISDAMMIAVDKADSAQFTYSDVVDSKGWELLSFLMDARTGLGRFRDFRIANYQLMMMLIDACRDTASIEDILNMPDVKERVDIYSAHHARFVDQIKRCTTVHGPLAVLDLRGEETIWAGNRFMIYALFPETNISCHVMWGKGNQNTVFAFGKSIFDRSNKTHVGNLMLENGGGGHAAAGTCQIDTAQAESVLKTLINKIKLDATQLAA